jgi:hypothetical protein
MRQALRTADEWMNHAGSKEAPFRPLATGTRTPRKNYPRLLRALIEARRLVPGRQIHFAIIGRARWLRRT